MRFPGTLSARVILGFAILVATFAGLSIATTANQDRLNQEIRVIRTGYLRLSLHTRDLAEKQSALVDYLKDELSDEVSTRRVAARIRRARTIRTTLLGQIGDTLANQTDIPANHSPSFAQSEARLREIRIQVSQAAALYDIMLAAPPIERVLSGETEIEASADQIEAAALAHVDLERVEERIRDKTTKLAHFQQRRVERTARNLEKGSEELRRLSVIFLAIAIVLGLIVLIWAVLTLRPLRRLPSAAQRIASGDYRARIDERGPTEIAELAREFNSMAEALESRERELVHQERLATVGKMAAMITHEVRNPLSAIGLNAELLEEELGDLDDDTTEARSLCSSIHTEIDRLTAITETYLQFARLPEPRLHPEDIAALIHNLVRFIDEEMSQKNIQLTVSAQETLPPVELDHAQIKQGLLNLLRNAGEALDGVKGAKLTITAHLDGDNVVVTVKDNGPGIPADVLPRLFEPFFTTKKSGTGLGLALTQQIIREHNGSLEVESSAGKGARFTIRLPLIRGPRVLGD